MFDNSYAGDSGVNINLMPYSFYKKLDYLELNSKRIAIHMANWVVTYPQGIIEDLLVKIGKFVFPIEFAVIDMK